MKGVCYSLHLVLCNLPGALAADLIMSQPASIDAAPSVPSRRAATAAVRAVDFLYRSQLWRAVLTCQDVSCSGDALGNGDQLSPGAR